MAGVIIVILPVIVLYLWTQKHLVEGIASGAVKG
jgi:sn-glycerol 3-phosphate transport system permease protein